MIDRDPGKFTLWAIASDQQGSLFGGNYSSELDAKAAIPRFDDALIKQGVIDEERYYQIEPPDSAD